MTRIAVLLAAVLFLGGCLRLPTDEELRNADYGTPISQDEAEKIARVVIGSTLKDPQSAQYSWLPIERGWLYTYSVWSGEMHAFGYLLEGTVNAKNAFGGYVGQRVYKVLFHNGKVIRMDGEVPMPGSRWTKMTPLI